MSATPIPTALTAPAGGAASSLEREREAATIAAIETRQAYDVATLSDEQFEQGLQRIRLRQKRLRRIIDTILVPGVHYMTEDRSGRTVFERPHLTIAGAAELRQQFRLVCRPVEAPQLVLGEDVVSAVVSVGCYDSAGRLLGVRSAACTTRERRFRARAGKGWVYDDPREMVHQCLAMAEKRAAAKVTAEVTGAVAFFAAEEEMERALEARETEAGKEGAAPWTEAEKHAVYEAAQKAGVRTRAQFERLVRETLGHAQPQTGPDVQRLLQALSALAPPGRRPVRHDADPYAPTPTSAEDQAGLTTAGGEIGAP